MTDTAKERILLYVSWTFISGLTALWLFPILWVLLTSFKTRVEITRSDPSLFFTPTASNYIAAWQDHDVGWSLLNSFIAASGATAITLVVGTMAAYSLARFQFKGSKNLALWILSLRMMPPIALLLPYYELFRGLQMIDTQIGLILIYLTITLPFAIWLLYGFIREIPREIDEAAFLDGCGYIRLLWRFIIPAAAPGIAVTGIFSFLFTWNEFLFAVFLTDSTAVTFPVAVSKFVLPYRVLWGELSAASVMALVPMVLILVFFQRYIVRGMTLGALR